MARQRDLSLLVHGAKYWNAKARTAGIGRADLTDASLVKARLDGVDLTAADLRGADLRGARIRRANLTHALLDEANLTDADISDSTLRGASLKRAKLERLRACRTRIEVAEFADSDLTDADFKEAVLTGSIFLRTDMTQTSFVAADLRTAVFYHSLMLRTKLDRADLASAYFGEMSVVNVDLSVCSGLATIIHRSRSDISFSTLRRNPTPDVILFAKRCGLNAIEAAFATIWKRGITQNEINDVAYEIARRRMPQSIMVNDLFISYAHTDTPFVDRLQPELERNGIQCWRDIKDLTVGKIDTQIDRAIRLNPTVLLILSDASVRSDWVEWEASAARRLERERNISVLCPIALDSSWRSCHWSAPLRQQIETYHMLDFSDWADEGRFKRQFARLREGLQLYYGNR